MADHLWSQSTDFGTSDPCVGLNEHSKKAPF